MNPKTLQYLMGHSNISVAMNVYTHIGFDDAEEELKRMEEFRKAQAEVEQKKEKPMRRRCLRWFNMEDRWRSGLGWGVFSMEKK